MGPPLGCRTGSFFRVKVLGTRKGCVLRDGPRAQTRPEAGGHSGVGRVPLGAAPSAVSPGGPHSQGLPTSNRRLAARCPLVAGQAPVGVAQDIRSLWGQHLRMLRVGELLRCCHPLPSSGHRGTGGVGPGATSRAGSGPARRARPCARCPHCVCVLKTGQRGKGSRPPRLPCPWGQLEPLVLPSEPLQTTPAAPPQWQCLGRGDPPHWHCPLGPQHSHTPDSPASLPF